MTLSTLEKEGIKQETVKEMVERDIKAKQAIYKTMNWIKFRQKLILFMGALILTAGIIMYVDLKESLKKTIQTVKIINK